MDGPGQQESVAGLCSASKEIKSESDSVMRKKETGCQYVNRNSTNSSSSNSSSSFLEHIHYDVSSDRTNERLANDNDGIIIPSNGIMNAEQEKPNCLSDNLNTNGLDSKTTKIKQIVEDAISPDSKQTVMNILDQVNQLSTAEKLLLYLKLPTGKSANVDPLRQPLNPLGSRFEIHQTITWIKTHLEEDQDVSLPKQDVYDEYLTYCNTNMMKPLSTADFGKVMKQVFPRVRPRRLGTRGNSRYCYAGMRKRMKLETPLLPDLGDSAKSSPEQCSEDEVVSAASCLIREWAEKLLGVRFDSLRDLACHLVEKLCVDSRSVAAFTLLSTNAKKCNGKESTSPLGLAAVPSGGHASKHRETQLQLQRKLQEREVIREQKRKLQDQQQSAAFSKGQPAEKLKAKRAKLSSQQNGRERKVQATNSFTQGNSLLHTSEAVHVSICDNTEVKLEEQSKRGKPEEDGGKNSTDGKRPVSNLLPTDASTNNNNVNINNNNSKYCTTFSPVHELNTGANNISSIANKSPIVITRPPPLLSLSSLGSPPRTGPANKIPIPRVTNPKPSLLIFPTATLSPQKPARKKYKPIQPKPKVEEKLKTEEEVEVGACKRLLSDDNAVGCGPVKKDTSLGDVAQTIKTGCLEKDSLGDYFHGGNNSQEHEEELIRYFQHQTSSSSNEELDETLSFRSSTADPCKSDKLSQLRLLLERNLNPAPVRGSVSANIFKSSIRGAPSLPSLLPASTEEQASNDDVFLSNPSVQIPAGASASVSLSLLSQRSQLQQQNNRGVLSSTKPLLPSLLTSGHGTNSGLSTRRRVSFETSVMEHYHQEQQNHTVPPSPNTRRRIFSFTPISPGPHSPISTAHQRASSKPSSANASPFVSPRNTPVPRTRHTIGANGSTSSTQVNSSFIASAASQTRSRLGGTAAAKIVRSNSVNSSLPSSQYQPARPRALSTTTPVLQSTNNLNVSVDSLRSMNTNNLLAVSNSNRIENGELGPMMFSMPGELQLSLSSMMSGRNAAVPPMSPLSISAPQSPMVSFSTASVMMGGKSEPMDQEPTANFPASESLLQAVLQSTTKPQQYNPDTYLSQEASEQALQSLEASMAADMTNRAVQQQPLSSDPLAHEVSQFFSDDNSDRHNNFVQLQYRSQSVPLHRMASASTLVSPLYLAQQPSFTFNNFASSAASSVAPTPVPSECMDFVGVTENSNTTSNLLMVDEDGNDPETEGLNSENLNRIFNLLDDAQEGQNPVQNSLSLALGDTDMTDIQTQRSLLQTSRSYPNTPIPYKSNNVRDPVVTSFTASPQTMEASPSVLGSRSLPPTPLLSMPLFGSSDDDAPFQSISESDTTLTLNALNTRLSANGASFAARRNITALLEEELTLETLEELQVCDSFSQFEQPCTDS